MKSEAERKPSSGLKRKPSSAYKYPFTNTQGYGNGASLQELQRTLIFQDENLRHGFAQVPNTVIRDSSLSGNEKTLYTLLLSYAWQNKECFPGQETLAENMGLTDRSIRQLLNALKAKKLISWKRRGQGQSSIYYIRRLSDAYPQFVDKSGR